MNKNRLLIILGVGILSLTSCNTSTYNGELKEVRLSDKINYINEYRLNSNLKYKIPLKSSKELLKEDIKEIKLDNNKINDYELETIDESNYKYYLLVDSSNSYSNLKITLFNNKTYEYNVNLYNYSLDEYSGNYSFYVYDFKVLEEGAFNKYKLTYSLRLDKNFGIYLYNSLKIAHPIFNGSACAYNLDDKYYISVGGGMVNLAKNTNYLIEIEFSEPGFTYYFDEYMPFKINFNMSNEKYIFPQNQYSSYSKILNKIF